MPAITLFDFLNSINKKTKKYSSEEVTKDFNIYMINSFMSCDAQLAGIANCMNMNGYTKQMVYDFYYNAIPKNGKFLKYAKKEKVEKNIEYISEFFQVNMEVAKGYAKVISKEEMDMIVEFYEKRGVFKSTPKKKL